MENVQLWMAMQHSINAVDMLHLYVLCISNMCILWFVKIKHEFYLQKKMQCGVSDIYEGIGYQSKKLFLGIREFLRIFLIACKLSSRSL